MSELNNWKKDYGVEVCVKCMYCGCISTYFFEMTPIMIDEIMKIATSVATCDWCCEVKPVVKCLGTYDYEQISRNGKLVFYDRNQKDIYTLDLEKFLYGVKVACARSIVLSYDEFSEEGGCHYSERIIDYIIQYALFGKIKYKRKDDDMGTIIYDYEENEVSYDLFDI